MSNKNKISLKLSIAYIACCIVSFSTLHSSQATKKVVTVATPIDGKDIDTSGLANHPGLGTALTSSGNNYNPIKAAQQIQEQHIKSGDAFFNNLPQPQKYAPAGSKTGTIIPQAITTEIDRVYKAGLGFSDDLMSHVYSFYGLLYLVAEDEALANLKANNDTLPTAASDGTVSMDPPLTGAQLLSSKVWQDYLKIKIAHSYVEEQNLLKQVYENELQTFSMIPQFEFNYYQDSFTQLRALSQLTRVYLLLTDRLRKRALSQCEEWEHVVGTGLKGQALMSARQKLFSLIYTFQQSDFYAVTKTFEAINPEKTTVLPEQPDLANFPSMFKKDGKTGYWYVEHTYAPFFTITPKQTDPKKAIVSMTGLGVEIYTGQIDRIKDPKNPSFTKTPLFSKLFIEDPKSPGAITPTLGYMELLVFSAIKILHSETQYLFSSENLNNTMGKIKSLGPVSIPFFIHYTDDDYMFLRDINDLQAELNNNKLTATSVNPSDFLGIGHAMKSSFEPVGKWFKGAGESIGKWFKGAGMDIYDHVLKPMWGGIKNAGLGIWHGMKATWDETQTIVYSAMILPCAVIDIGKAAAGEHNPFADTKAALKSAQKYQKEVHEEVAKTMSHLHTAVNDISEAAKSLVKIAGSAVSTVLGVVDKQLGKDMAGLMDSVADTLIDQMADKANFFVQAGGELVQLTSDAVFVASNVMGDVVTGQWGAAGDAFKTLGEDMASAVLSMVTMLVSDLEQQFKDVMQVVGYFVSSLTDIVNVVAAALAAAAEFIAAGLSGHDPFSAAASEYSKVHKIMNQHRRLISGIITTVILVAATIATGGAASAFAAGMLAVNVGMMAMNVAGDAQQDGEAIDKQKAQKELVAKMGTYVKNNELSIAHCVEQQSVASIAQLSEQSANVARGVGYYQNYFNEITNTQISNHAYSLGLKYNQRTSGDIMSADPGSLYGHTTQRMVLNPAGGFLIYNSGRETFSQEIAVAPFSLEAESKSSSDTISMLPTIASNWFELKDISNIPAKESLVGDIVFRYIYQEKEPFHIGIYLSERSVDTGEMNTLNKNLSDALLPGATISFSDSWNKLDTFNRQMLGYDNLAKMFVCYQKPATVDAKTGKATLPAPQLGIYSHNTTIKGAEDGWIPTQFKPITFKPGVWYRMQASLSGTSLTTAFWELDTSKTFTAQDKPPAAAQTATVTVQKAVPFTSITKGSQTAPANFSGSMGVIASGAAVEYKVITPATTVTPTKERIVENDAIQTAAKGNPLCEAGREQKWVNNKLEAVTVTYPEKPATPVATLTTTVDSILAGHNLYTTKDTLTNITDYVYLSVNTETTYTTVQVSKTNEPDGFISLITGNIYNEKGSLIGSNIDLVRDKVAKLQGQDKANIVASQKQYFPTIAGPYTIGTLSITTDQASLQNGLYIYAGKALSPNLPKGSNDYYMLSEITFGSDETTIATVANNKAYMNPAPENEANALVSLSTDEIYYLKTVGSGKVDGSLKVYDKYKTAIPQKTASAIDAIRKTKTTPPSPEVTEAIADAQSEITSGTSEINMKKGESAAQKAITQVKTDIAKLTTEITQLKVKGAAPETLLATLKKDTQTLRTDILTLSSIVTPPPHPPSSPASGAPPTDENSPQSLLPPPPGGGGPSIGS